MTFELLPLRFTFLARQPIHFGASVPANLLRGAFGSILRKTACPPDCPGARKCAQRASCSYARLFEPSRVGSGPSGLTDWPRPFVFRALHLDGRSFQPDSQFYFDVHLFDTSQSAVTAFVSTFTQLGEKGLGPGRGRAELVDVSQIENAGQPLAIDLEAGEAPVRRVAVRFISPTELKSAQALVREPEFGVLAARIRDRVSTLREAYGGGALEMDFSGFGERASRVKMTRCALMQVDATRRSTRSGHTHSIGGFTGEAEYEGDLREFVPFLEAGALDWRRAANSLGQGRDAYRHFCR